MDARELLSKLPQEMTATPWPMPTQIPQVTTLNANEPAQSPQVADDGSGLDPARTGLGAGLTNMRDRLEAIGGGLRIESTLGRGTRVVGTIPLER